MLRGSRQSGGQRGRPVRVRQNSFGPIVGGVAGTLLWFANTAAANAAVANLLIDTIGAIWPAFRSPSLRAAFLLGVYAILAVVNIRGVRSGVRLSVVTTLVKLTPLVLFVLAGLFAVHASNLRWVEVPPLALVGQGAVLMFFAFMGVEGALSTSGEVANPARTVPRAILLALAVVSALYIGVQVVAQGVLGGDLAQSKAPLVDAAAIIFGPWGSYLFLAATVLSATGYMAGDVLCSPRVLHALADERQLPRQLAFVHPRFGTPARAVVAYATICAIFALSGSFRDLAVFAASGTLVLYLICCLGVLKLRAQRIESDAAPFRAPGGPFVPGLACLIIVWMLTTLTARELLMTAGLVVASGIVYAVRERLQRRLAQRPEGAE